MSMSINSTSGITQNNLTANKSCQPLLKSAPRASDTFVSSKQKSNVSFGVSPEEAVKAVKPLTEKYAGSLVKAMKRMATGELNPQKYENKIRTTFVRLADNTPAAQKAKKVFSKAIEDITMSSPAGEETTKAIKEAASEVPPKITSALHKDNFNEAMEYLTKGASYNSVWNRLSVYTIPANYLNK